MRARRLFARPLARSMRGGASAALCALCLVVAPLPTALAAGPTLGPAANALDEPEATERESPVDTAIHDLRARAKEMREVGHVSRANQLDARADRIEKRLVQFRRMLGSDGSSPVIPRVDVRKAPEGKGMELVLSVESAQGRRELGVNPSDRRARVLVEESDGEAIEVKYRMAQGFAGLEKLRDAYDMFRDFGKKTEEPAKKNKKPKADPESKEDAPRRGRWGGRRR